MVAEFDYSDKGAYRVDYRQTVEQVYSSATAFVVVTRDDLACLNLVCDIAHKKIKNLPSWCLDYGIKDQTLRETGTTWQLGLRWPHARDSNFIDHSVLRVDGFLFDIVVETATLLKLMSDTLTNHGLSAVCNLATQLESGNASICRMG